jgi:RNA polymerase sigma-70 factor, ECF subfamily
MAGTREDHFRALYESTRPRIIAYVLRRIPSRDDAADVVAETFEIAWRRLDDVPSGDAGLLWLYVTARHVLANHGRRVQRRDELNARLAEELRGVELRGEPRDAEGLDMQSSLAALSPEDRELLMLSGWEGLRAAEIGRVLGCTPTAARIRLHRARTRLKVVMGAIAMPEKDSDPCRHKQDVDEVQNDVPEEVVEQ